MRLAELSVHLGLHKTTTLRLLRTLVAERVLRQDPATGRYVANMAAWTSLAPSALVPRAFLSTVQNLLEELAGSAGATSSIGLPDETGRAGTVPMWATPQTRLYYDPRRGPESSPQHASASGKCWLASLPDGELNAYLAPGLERVTSRTITSPVRLRRELRRVRTQGFAFNRGEVLPVRSAIAVPLQGPGGAVAGGLALTFVGPDAADAAEATTVPLLRKAAGGISEALGDNWWHDRARKLDSAGRQPPSLWEAPDGFLSDDGVQLVRSVSRWIRLTAVLLRSPEGVSLADLARQRGLNRAAAHRLASTLVSEGMWRYDPARRCYRVHPVTWLHLAPILTAASSLANLVRSLLRELAEGTGATASLAFPDGAGRRTVLQDFVLPDNSICWHPEDLLLAPLHATASGKCVLASRSRLAIEAYMDHGLPALTKHTISSRKALLQELARVRRMGYAVVHEEFHPGVGVIAVPVTDGSGAVVGGIAVTPVIHELTEANTRRWVPLLRRAAQRLGSALVADWRDELLSDKPSDLLTFAR